MTPDGFPEDDDDTQRPEAPAVVQHVYNERAKGDGRSNARVLLWSLWVAGFVLYWALTMATSYAAGGIIRPPWTVDSVAGLLVAFFFFYALDRIIG